MSRKAVDIALTDSEREQLERWSREHQTPRSLAERAQIILMVSQGLRNDVIGNLGKNGLTMGHTSLVQ